MSYPVTDSVAQADPGHASRTVVQPMSPPPLPEVLRQRLLAKMLPSAFTG
jgi:hypothetical protein